MCFLKTEHTTDLDHSIREADIRLDVLSVVLDDDGTDHSDAVQEGHIPKSGLNSKSKRRTKVPGLSMFRCNPKVSA